MDNVKFSDELVLLVSAFGNKMPTHIPKIKKYETFYKLILQETQFLDLGASISQRLWHIRNNLKSVPICLDCSNTVNWQGTKYSTFCSPKCARNNKSVIDKYKASLLENYGVEFPLQSKEIRQKVISTNMDRYGVDHPAKTSEQKESKRKYFLEKYGVDHNSKIHIPKQSHDLLNDISFLYGEHILNKKTLTKIAEELGIDKTMLSERIKKFGIQPQRFQESSGEREISNIIEPHFSLIKNDRTVIAPLELDIYIPEKKIAIEYNGLYWHSSEKKTNTYHKDKYDACKNSGVRLIQIYEDEWVLNRKLVTKKLLRILGITDDKRVHARNCTIMYAAEVDARTFFNENHIQGFVNNSINIGLYQNDELVACMGFKNRNDSIYELTRYATKYNVVGGFTKLLSYFKKTYDWSEIITFADLRWHDGNVYKLSGFEIDGIVKPSYEYILNNKRIHKFNFRKKQIQKKFPTEFDPNLTEIENMDKLGIPRIYDCGKIRFVLRK